MSETHWKSLTNPDYLGGYSLEPGKDLVLTIKQVRKETVTGPGGKKEECIVCHWQEDQKPMILNNVNCKTITKLLGTPYIEQWSGHEIEIYFDPKVKFGSETTGGLRIRPQLPEKKQIACEECGQFITPAFSMNVSQLAAYTKKKYGKNLCSECATAAAKKEETKNE